MKRLNDYFVNMKQRTNIPQQMSLCGKLEAIIGNYFLAGAGIPDASVEILYYDSKVGFYDDVPLLKENIVAYIVADERVIFVRDGMLEKIMKDTEGYGLIYIPVNSFEDEELYIDNEIELPSFLEGVLWVDDDFLNDEDITFDFETFEIIDSGTEYVNPKHFSVSGLINVLNNE